MKKTTLILVLSIIFNYGHAQHFNPETYHKQQSQRLQADILARQTERSLPNTRTAGTDKRLIAISLYQFNALIDSFHHFYSGNRGSSHPNDKSYFSSDYGLYTKDPFNLLETIQYIQSDSSIWYEDLNTNPHVSWSMYNQYDADNNIISENILSTSDTVSAAISYNNAGKESVVRIWHPGTVPTSDTLFHYFLYDGQNRLTLDSVIEGNNHSYKIRYHYNNAGLPERMEWYQMDTISDRTLYTYDAQARLLTSEEQMRTDILPSGWFPTYRDTFGYTGNATQHTYREIQSWNMAITEWHGLISRIYELNTSGGIVTSYEIHTASGDTLEIMNYFYTPEGLYDRIEDAVPDVFTVHFHYEAYNPATGLPVTMKASHGLTVYPNPVHTVLNISVTDPAVTGVTIFDLTGKIIRNYPVNGTESYQIDISDLSAGSYLMRSNGDSPAVQKFSVIR